MKTLPHAEIHPHPSGYGETALTKREHFAAMAMQGLLANSSVYQGYSTPQQQADLSLAHADALIEALNKEEQ